MIFFHKIFARFSKVLVFNKDLRDTEGILKFAQNCVDTSQNLKNVTRCRQVWWNELWKNTLKFFFRRKDSFSWKKFSDDYLILTETILYLIKCTINVERLRGPLNNFFWGLSFSVKQEEESYFFHWNVCLFVFFSKHPVFDNLPGLWELTFLVAPILLEYFVACDISVMDVCKTRYYEKNIKVFFFTGRVTFFRKFLFPTITQLLQKWSCNLQNSCLNIFGPMELLPDVAILSNTRENRSKS